MHAIELYVICIQIDPEDGLPVNMCTVCETAFTSINMFRNRTVRAMDKLVEIRTRANIIVGMTAQHSDQAGLTPLHKDTVQPKIESEAERAVDNAFNETIGYLHGYSLNTDNAAVGVEFDTVNNATAPPADPTQPSASTASPSTHTRPSEPSEVIIYNY